MSKMEMSDAARQAKREYERKWYASNKEKRAAITKRYWERRAAKDAEKKEAEA